MNTVHTLTSCLLTCLQAARFGAQICQVDISFPAVNDGVGVFASPLCSPPICHGHLRQQAAGRLLEHREMQTLQRLLSSQQHMAASTRTTEHQTRHARKHSIQISEVLRPSCSTVSPKILNDSKQIN